MSEDAPAITVTFPDGRKADVARGSPVGAALERWRPDLRKRLLAATWEGIPVDLSHPIVGPGELAPLTFDDAAGKEILRHSAAHLVAKAVTEVIPSALPTVGPPTEEGFYYDFDVRPLTPEDISQVQAAIARAVQAQEPFARRELSKPEALQLLAKNRHKQGYIADVPADGRVSFYSTGDFLDLCRGPHVPHTGHLRGIHLLGFSAVTQGGTADGLPLQRIRGVAFPTAEELATFLRLRAEAEARDHRVLGPRLDLFSFVEESPGFPFWHPRGMIVVRELEKFVLEHLHAEGYSEIRTPLMFARSIFETSGHWEHYRADLFLTSLDGREFAIKPMNCPGSMLIFRSRARSYRELPMRLAEFAPLHRVEASGTIHGMTRVREFIQDDAHLFVTEDQIAAEVATLLRWVREAFSLFQFEWSYELSTRPAQFLGEPALWDRAEAILEEGLKASGTPYQLHAGEGAFYGPKIDIHLRDSLGRPWQTGTIQLDFQLPRRFGLEYQGPDGAMHVPVVIHRTILGSWERFIGVLLEHCAGRLPPWLAPVQVRVLPVSEPHAPGVAALVTQLRSKGIRAEATGSEETLSKRVRAAELERIPYVLVLGDQEAAQGTVAIRRHGIKGQESVAQPAACDMIAERVRVRSFAP
ncbi:MAG: threonine--tRNA ligase [Thermoplasmata archaeon]|nr:threonine--tRNA ligase [Thermoplasmata archaeon]